MRRRHAYLLAFAIQLALAPLFVHDWDGFVLIRSAQDLLAGVTPYQVSEAAPQHIFLDDHWPPVNTWYAYPPLELLLITPFVALAQWLSGEPWALRVGLKLPMILANLALAYVAGRLVADLRSEDAGRRAERLLLLNPFLIFVGAVWGMFDATMMALLLLSVLLVARGRLPWAGVAFGLAALVKVFPLFVAPLFAWYVLAREGWRRALAFVGAAVATAAAVALPFFATAPEGFLRQVLFMHFDRGAQGFALVSFPLQLANVNNLLGWSIPIAPESIVLAVSGTLLLVTVVLLHALAPTMRDPVGLLRVVAVVFIAVLLVNKVVNEQYFVMPIVLLTLLGVLRALPDLRAARAYTWGAFVSSILIGLHFLTFVPADLTGGTALRPDEVVQMVADATDLPVIVVFSAPHALAILALVPALLASLRFVLPHAREALALATHGLARLLVPVTHRRAPHFAGFAVVLLIALPPVTSGVLAVPEPALEAPPLPDAGLLLARYDLAIHNPSHNPEVRDGFWARGDYPATADGYYSATTGKVREDLAVLKGLGVDVVLVSYSAGNRLRLDTFLEAARDAQLQVAPVLDLGALAHCPDAQRMRPSVVPPLGDVPETPEAHALAATCVASALHPFRAHPVAFRVDGRPVLWLRNATAYGEGDAVRGGAPDAFLVAGVEPARPQAPAWADAAYVQPPIHETLDAFLDASGAFASPRRIAAVFDRTWSASDAFDATWDAAQGAHWVVLGWNTHRDGGALEPLAGGDDALLRRAESAAAGFQTL